MPKAYCFKCHRKVEVSGATDNGPAGRSGNRVMKGKCSRCGGKVAYVMNPRSKKKRRQ